MDAMEQLRGRVRSVEVLPKARLAVARVSATSARKVTGRPVARINLRITFRVARGEPASVAKQRARDDALAFLDVT